MGTIEAANGSTQMQGRETTNAAAMKEQERLRNAVKDLEEANRK